MASSPLFFFLLLILAGIIMTSASSGETGAGRNSSSSSSTEFVRKSCNATRFPSICYKSLAGYAAVVERSDVKLAHVAANFTLARLRPLSARVSALSRNATGADRPALRDCAEVLADAADWARQTVVELKGLDKVVGPEVAWRVSNALTWMSAALTDEDTCTEGIAKSKPAAGGVKADVYCRVRKVGKYTSNALALIHLLGFNN
ncbi:hypothetical protein Cni_G20383 [Canna indica]|uniref:Pectinesterase inhibitor domain-containing protein n=1 Tax=Canna indica TaxID=4628 RepID=A0AAQ3KN36_9LILI|nr:hypothetical protein Cni_G20383 [Canna indica]